MLLMLLLHLLFSVSVCTLVVSSHCYIYRYSCMLWCTASISLLMKTCLGARLKYFHHSSTRVVTLLLSFYLFQFRLGSVSLKAAPEPADAVRNLLIHSLERGNRLEHHNQKLDEENRRLRREQQRITAE